MIDVQRKGLILLNTIIFLLFLAAEIFIGMYCSGWIRFYFGDVLIMPTMFFLIRIFTDKLKKSLPLILFLFACFVELLQSLNICDLLGIERDSLLAIIIGTSGAIEDIWCYAAGTALIYINIIIIQMIERRRKNG